MAKTEVKNLDKTKGEQYCASFRRISREQCFPLSRFEKHPKVQTLLAAKPEHQIAFARRFIGESVHGFHLVGARRATPIRVLKNSDRSSERKMEVYRHFRNLWQLDWYPLAGNLGLHVLLKHRDVPFTHDDLVYLADHLADQKMVVLACNPFAAGLVRHLQAYVEKHGASLELNKAIRRLASAMDVPDQPADHQKVFRQLKKLAGARPAKEKAAIKQASQADVGALAAQYVEQLDRVVSPEPFREKSVLEALAAHPTVHVAMVRTLAERVAQVRKGLPAPIRDDRDYDDDDRNADRVVWMYFCLRDVKTYPHMHAEFVSKVLARRLAFTSGDLEYIVGKLADFELVSLGAHQFLPNLLRRLEQHVSGNGVTPKLAKQMKRLADAMDAPVFTNSGNTGAAAQRRAIATLRDLAAMAAER